MIVSYTLENGTIPPWILDGGHFYDGTHAIGVLDQAAADAAGVSYTPLTRDDLWEIIGDIKTIRWYESVVRNAFPEKTDYPTVMPTDILLADSKADLLVSIAEQYESLRSGVDLNTGKSLYVDCVVDGTTYRMNGGEKAAISMDSGVRIFERQGASVMPIVRDFYDVNHIDVPLATAISISVQQGVNALSFWQQKGAMVDAVNAATTIEEINNINTTFTVTAE
jgi:hypothetical protein